MSSQDKDQKSPLNESADSTEESRRGLLKKLAAGGVAGAALPAAWSKPVIDSVILPAHAQTTGARTIVGGGGGTTGPGPAPSRSPGGDLLDFFVSPARAGANLDLSEYCVEVEVTVLDDEVTGVKVTRACVVGDGCKGGELVELENGKKSLSRSGGSWRVKFNNDEMVISNINTGAGSKLADIVWGGNARTLLKGLTCSCVEECEEPEEQVSDRALKDNFATVREQEILEKVAAMPVEYWNYTDRDPGVRHIGPMAQDFHAAFEVGGSDERIHMVDANGVNLASIKALYQRLEEKDARIARLEGELAVIKETLGITS